jgi:hypothetical protein
MEGIYGNSDSDLFRDRQHSRCANFRWDLDAELDRGEIVFRRRQLWSGADDGTCRLISWRVEIWRSDVGALPP